MAVGRIKGRCSFVRAFEGRWRSGIEGGGRRGRTGEGGGCRVVVHTGGPREETGAALGVLRMEPTGRRVEVGGDATWVEATTSKSDFRFTCYTSASSTSPPLPLLGSPNPLPFPYPGPCTRSLTHNSRTLFIPLSSLAHPLYVPVVAAAPACLLDFGILCTVGTYYWMHSRRVP